MRRGDLEIKLLEVAKNELQEMQPTLATKYHFDHYDKLTWVSPTFTMAPLNDLLRGLDDVCGKAHGDLLYEVSIQDIEKWQKAIREAAGDDKDIKEKPPILQARYEWLCASIEKVKQIIVENENAQVSSTPRVSLR